MDAALTHGARIVTGAAARHLIARAVLADDGQAEDAASRLGEIVLAEHQRDAVRRLRAILACDGGALLADDVGLGKTFVALALAREAARPVVVAPAALRPMWREAMRRAGVHVPFTSHEALSRGGAASAAPADLLIIDEAHHARNPGTRRWRALADLARGARVLLLSATPIHNRRDDLVALLSLFMGAAAAGLADEHAARLIVRRTSGAPDDGARPCVLPTRRLDVGDDAATLRAILALPPPVPPADGGLAGALIVHGLVRQWASSQGALRGAILRRLARAIALEDALAAGRHPTSAELRAWRGAEDAVQLAFPELVASGGADPALLDAVRAHAHGLRVLRRTLDAGDAADAARATALLALCAAHGGERIVAFTQFAETATALFARLRATARVAALTAHGAVVAGGRLSRREAIARFAPRAAGAPPPPNAERIDLLLTTDLLSEGVNLQDASVVVHLDRPWTPARLEQRVGRAARLGSPHERVTVYELAPPAPAELVLRSRDLLRAKLRAAADVIGTPSVLARMLDAELDETDGAPATAAHEAVRARLRRWLSSAPGEPATPSGPAVAVVRGRLDGLLVAARLDGAVLAGRVAPHDLGTTPAVVELLCEAAEGPDDARGAGEVARALAEARRWIEARRAAADAGIGTSGVAAARQRVLERIARIVRRTPAHRRARIAALAGEARAAAMERLSAADERALRSLAASPLPDEAWLGAVVAGASSGSPAGRGDDPPALLALIVIRP